MSNCIAGVAMEISPAVDSILADNPNKEGDLECRLRPKAGARAD